jgi:hypothetical protein
VEPLPSGQEKKPLRRDASVLAVLAATVSLLLFWAATGFFIWGVTESYTCHRIAALLVAVGLTVAGSVIWFLASYWIDVWLNGLTRGARLGSAGLGLVPFVAIMWIGYGNEPVEWQLVVGMFVAPIFLALLAFGDFAKLWRTNPMVHAVVVSMGVLALPAICVGWMMFLCGQMD